MTRDWLRRIGWITIGLVGLPMAALSVLYFIGLILLPAAFAVGVLQEPTVNRRLPELAAGLIAAAVVAGLGAWATVAALVGSGEDAAGLIFLVSGVAALAASYKLGKTVARVWPSRPRNVS